MRALAVLLVLSAPAYADHTPVPLPRVQRSLDLGFETTMVGPVAIAAGGLEGEVAWARGHAGRWQLVAEGAAMHVFGDRSGEEVRLGGAARWLARSFEPDSSASIEMWLEAGVGVEAFAWSGGGRLARPDATFGWGWQIRKLEEGGMRWVFRYSLELVLTPTAGDTWAADAVCRGVCNAPLPPHPVDGGMIGMFGVSW